MPTLSERGTWYIRRRLPHLGPVRRSLGTRSKEHARDLERMLIVFGESGKFRLLRAWYSGREALENIYDAHITGRLAELEERLALPDVPPLSAAIRESLKFKAPDVAPRTLRAYTDNLERFRQYVGDIPADDALTTDNVQRYKAFRLQSVGRDTVNNDLAALAVLSTFAMRRGWIGERPGLKAYKTPPHLVWLEPVQANAYLGCLRPAFRPLMATLIGTGMRLGEAESLRHCDVRFGQGCRLHVQDSKTPEGIRPVYAPDWVAAILRDHIEAEGLSGTDRLFAIPRRVVQREHHRARTLAGIDLDYSVKDHRHSFAVSVARVGMPLPQIAQQLGHTDIKVTMIYARFSPSYSDNAPYFDAVAQSLGRSDDRIHAPPHETAEKRDER